MKYLIRNNNILINCTPHEITLYANNKTEELFPSGMVLNAIISNNDINETIFKSEYKPDTKGIKELNIMHEYFTKYNTNKIYCLSSTISVKAYSHMNPYHDNIYVVGMVQLTNRKSSNMSKVISGEKFYIL